MLYVCRRAGWESFVQHFISVEACFVRCSFVRGTGEVATPASLMTALRGSLVCKSPGKIKPNRERIGADGRFSCAAIDEAIDFLTFGGNALRRFAAVVLARGRRQQYKQQQRRRHVQAYAICRTARVSPRPRLDLSVPDQIFKVCGYIYFLLPSALCHPSSPSLHIHSYINLLDIHSLATGQAR